MMVVIGIIVVIVVVVSYMDTHQPPWIDSMEKTRYEIEKNLKQLKNESK
jgi:Na+/melibiose symporter-like transporter